MPSFDVVSEVDTHELTNAVDQANREIEKRFDFKGIDASFELQEDQVVMQADVDFQLQQMLDVLRNKMIARKIDIRCMDVQGAERGNMRARQVVKLKQGLDQATAKKINKMIKDDKKLKVQAQIQGDQVRVTGKKRDDLQAVIAMLRESDLDIPLQFNNFRD
jgi:uncharacterized protein YajQ (UPF0234 family)